MGRQVTGLRLGLGTKLMSHGHRKGGKQLYLRKEIADMIPAHTLFVAELCEEGVLFRVVEPLPRPSVTPSWLNERSPNGS